MSSAPRKLLGNARPRIEGLCTVSSGAGTGTALGFAYSSAVLPSTFPAAHPPRWNSARTRRCGYALTSEDRDGERAGGCRCRGQHSRVFLVPIHNCKFPSPYLCSPSSHRAPARFADSLIRACLPPTPPVQTRQTENDVFFFSTPLPTAPGGNFHRRD